MSRVRGLENSDTARPPRTPVLPLASPPLFYFHIFKIVKTYQQYFHSKFDEQHWGSNRLCGSRPASLLCSSTSCWIQRSSHTEPRGFFEVWAESRMWMLRPDRVRCPMGVRPVGMTSCVCVGVWCFELRSLSGVICWMWVTGMDCWWQWFPMTGLVGGREVLTLPVVVCSFRLSSDVNDAADLALGPWDAENGALDVWDWQTVWLNLCSSQRFHSGVKTTSSDLADDACAWINLCTL